jgi:cytochrome c oxidase subunit 2
MSRLALINEFLGQPPNASEHGYQIDHIIEFCHWFMGALFVGWVAYFIFVLIRFHRTRHPVADHYGVKSAISTHLEFSVVLIEAVLLLGFAIPLWAKRVNQFPDTHDAVLVHVIGQQFNWTYHMPGPDGQYGRRDAALATNENPVGLDYNDPASRDDIVVLGELHVPVNRPVIMEISSKDVIHNFDLTNMRIAQDAIPGSIIPMWFKPIKTGTYEVICGQLCGLGHYSMKGSVVVDTAEDFQNWLKERSEFAQQQRQQAPKPTERPPGEPVQPTPGTIPPPGAPKNANPAATNIPQPVAAPSPQGQ